MAFFRLSHGDMEGIKTREPMHSLFGYGSMAVGSVVVADHNAAGVLAIDLQRAVHSYGQATGKKFTTRKTIDKDAVVIKRIA